MNLLEDSKIKLQLKDYNTKEIIKAYCNEFVSTFAKIIKGEYSKFSISSSDIMNNLKYVNLDHNKNDISFKIINETNGNYLIENISDAK